MTNPTPVVAEEIPVEEREELLAKLAGGIVDRRLSTPAILLLETCKPLNFVGSQFMLAMQPFVTAFFKGDDYRKAALILEEDHNLESLMARIESLESKRLSVEQTSKAKRERRPFWRRVFGKRGTPDA